MNWANVFLQVISLSSAWVTGSVLAMAVQRKNFFIIGLMIIIFIFLCKLYDQIPSLFA
jgi:hypothetical protein